MKVIPGEEVAVHYQLLVSDMMHLGNLRKTIDRFSEDNRRVMWLDLSPSKLT